MLVLKDAVHSGRHPAIPEWQIASIARVIGVALILLSLRPQD